MAGVWVPPGKQRFTNPADDSPLVGGQVFFYIPGTDTPKDTWQDAGQAVLNDNPITLDAEGEAVIWGDGLYRQVLFDSIGNQIWDEVTGFLGGGGGSVDFASPAEVAALASTTKVISPYALGASGVLGGGGGGGNYGASKPLADYGFTLDLSGVTVGGNDDAFTAAQADATNLHIYTPAGTLRTNLTKDQLTKGYLGDGSIRPGPGAGDGTFRPPRYGYMATKPTTWPVQGVDGFWRGDQRFSTGGGEWKEIGPLVRTYDLTSRYYESNTMPIAAWFDVYSGNSGAQGFLTSGANIGDTTVTIQAPASIEWIGKTMAFAPFMDGVISEQVVVSGVAGNTITFAPALANNYVWNPAGGQTPTIYFGKRTSAQREYVKSIGAGGGDNYQLILRQNGNYVPKASETHVNMAGTFGNLGGDTYANANGIYLQNQEWQLQGQSYDVAAISYLASLTRNVDYALDGGKVWLGSYIKADGARPSDVAHCVAGFFRNVLDTAFATLYETSRLTVAANAGDFVITVASVNGVHPGDPCVIGAETKTINTFNTGTKQVGFTTPLAGSYAVDTFVKYSKGGAVVSSALGQRYIFNSTVSQNARGGDPLNVYSAIYGNVQGDLIMESGNDGATDYWSVRFARGASAALPDTARLRVRPTGVQLFGTGHTCAGTMGFTQSISLLNNQPILLGTNGILIFDGVNLKASANGGGSYNILA